jgi:hypothetical protein
MSTLRTYNVDSGDATNLSIKANGNTIITVVPSGGLGIGTTATGTYRVSISGSIAGSGPLYLNTDTANSYVYSPSSVYVGSISANTLGLVTNNVERVRVTSTGAVGIGTVSPPYPLEVRNDDTGTTTWSSVRNATATGAFGAGFIGIIGTGGTNYFTLNQTASGTTSLINANAGSLSLGTNGVARFTIGSDGSISTTGSITTTGYGIGIGLSATAGFLQIDSGNTTFSPIKLTSSGGTLVTSPAGGEIEYDGTRFYGVADTTSGRGYFPTVQYFRLAANTPTALAITPSNFFGGSSRFNLSASSTYELEAFLYFTKTTAGTLTVSINQSSAPTFTNATLSYGSVGGTGSQALSQIQMFANPNANAAFSASNTLTTTVNHAVRVNAVIGTNLTGTANVTVWQSAGTLNPLRGSYIKLTRLPSANTGTFS